MQPAPLSVVHGLAGLRGTVLTTSSPPGTSTSQVAVKLSDGQIVVVQGKQLVLQPDQTYFLALSPTDVGSHATRGGAGTAVATAASTDRTDWAAASVDAGDEVRIPRVEERLEVGKAEQRSTVRIRKTVHEREEVVDVPLLREQVDVERVAVNRVVETAPAVRQEGDVTVIPVLEEVLVVEKRLMLREELRVTRRKDEVREPQHVILRTEQVEVTREDEGATAAANEPATAGSAV